MNTKIIISSVVLIFALLFGIFLLERQASVTPNNAPTPPTAHNGTMTSIVSNPDASTFIQLTKINPAFYNDFEGKGQYTLLVPTDQAFANSSSYSLQTLKNDPSTLTLVLLVHAVPNLINTKDLKDGMSIPTLEGKILTVTKVNGSWHIDGARIVTPDIHSTNGVVHIIDKVIEPIPYKP